MSAKVFVGNLNFRTTKEELSELLGSVGEIVDVYLPNDRETGRPRGFAFVQFATEEAAAEAITKFDGHEFGGRNLRVNLAEERRPRGFGGGGGGGFGGGGFGGGGFGGYRQPLPATEGGEFTPFGGGESGDRDRGSWSGGRPSGGGPPPGRPKGSRRGLRAKKRSL